MMATVRIPAADVLPLPAPAPLLDVLLHLTFLLHLLAMNALLGGLLLTLWHRLRASGPGDPRRHLADAMAGTTPSLVAAAVTLGVAPLLFLQTLYGQFFFTSSILMGWGWFSVVVVLVFAYYGTYLQAQAGPRLGAARIPLLGLTVLLFLWIAFMFSNNTSLMIRPTAWNAMYFADPGGRHLNLGDPTLPPRYLHMVLGAVAVSGLLLGWWGRLRLRRGDGSGATMIMHGARAFTGTTLLNVLVGLWYLMALERPVMRLFMGGDPLATGAFGLGFVLALILLLLGWRAMRAGTAASLAPVTVLVLVTLVAMIVMRNTVRLGSLGDHYRPAEFPVQTQALNLTLFALLLAGGAATVIWMVRRLHRAWER
jgi:hypothetical protein